MFGHSIYIGITAIIINTVIAVVLTPILRAARVPEGADETLPHQYTADPGQAPAPVPAEWGALEAGGARPFEQDLRLFRTARLDCHPPQIGYAAVTSLW